MSESTLIVRNNHGSRPSSSHALWGLPESFVVVVVVGWLMMILLHGHESRVCVMSFLPSSLCWTDRNQPERDVCMAIHPMRVLWQWKGMEGNGMKWGMLLSISCGVALCGHSPFAHLLKSSTCINRRMWGGEGICGLLLGKCEKKEEKKL